jgi:hypothetical protein
MSPPQAIRQEHPDAKQTPGEDSLPGRPIGELPVAVNGADFLRA